MSEGFFSRWSRRKMQIGLQAPLQSEPATATESAGVPDHEAVSTGKAASPPSAPGQSVQDLPQSAEALPTIDDVQLLNPASDFQPFMRRGVAPEVRNAAMKKLFADPHFNVMDGLDIYIDDYSQPDPMPASMLRRMASAQFLGLVPEEAPARQAELAQAPVLNPKPADGMEVVAQSPDSSAAADTQSHDHPDLQLQPDPSPADSQPGSGPR